MQLPAGQTQPQRLGLGTLALPAPFLRADSESSALLGRTVQGGFSHGPRRQPDRGSDRDPSKGLDLAYGVTASAATGANAVYIHTHMRVSHALSHVVPSLNDRLLASHGFVRKSLQGWLGQSLCRGPAASAEQGFQTVDPRQIKRLQAAGLFSLWMAVRSRNPSWPGKERRSAETRCPRSRDAHVKNCSNRPTNMLTPIPPPLLIKTRFTSRRRRTKPRVTLRMQYPTLLQTRDRGIQRSVCRTREDTETAQSQPRTHARRGPSTHYMPLGLSVSTLEVGRPCRLPML